MADVIGLSVVDAAKRAGVGRSTLYEAIRSGDLTARELGRRTVILQAELHQWLASLRTVKSDQVGPEASAVATSSPTYQSMSAAP